MAETKRPWLWSDEDEPKKARNLKSLKEAMAEQDYIIKPKNAKIEFRNGKYKKVKERQNFNVSKEARRSIPNQLATECCKVRMLIEDLNIKLQDINREDWITLTSQRSALQNKLRVIEFKLSNLSCGAPILGIGGEASKITVNQNQTIKR